jgi:hypothetical protein
MTVLRSLGDQHVNDLGGALALFGVPRHQG